MSRSRVWQRVNGLLKRQSSRTDDDSSETEERAIPEMDHDLLEASMFTISRDDSKKQSREKLRQSFSRNNVFMRVTMGDVIPATDDEHDDADLYRGRLKLPYRQVPNCCVICLDSYHPGDSVVWSCNPDCPHAFHEACQINYLARILKKVASTPCCVCRCNFTDLEVEQRERHLRRRGRGGRRTVRTQHNLAALELPSWWISSSKRQFSSS